MSTSRRGVFWARVTLGTALGVVLVVAGMSLIRRTLSGSGSLEGYEGSLGATGVAAGLVWFMIVVADRVCPLSRRGIVDGVEGLLMALMLVGLGWSARMFMHGTHG